MHPSSPPLTACWSSVAIAYSRLQSCHVERPRCQSKYSNLKPTRQIISTDFVSRHIYPWKIGNLGREERERGRGGESRKILRGAGKALSPGQPAFCAISIFPFSPSEAAFSFRCPKPRWLLALHRCLRSRGVDMQREAASYRLAWSLQCPRPRAVCSPLALGRCILLDSGFTRRQRGA